MKVFSVPSFKITNFYLLSRKHLALKSYGSFKKDYLKIFVQNKQENKAYFLSLEETSDKEDNLDDLSLVSSHKI